MELLFVGVLLLGSIIALSGIIIAKSPNAKQMIDKLMPFQAVIGVAMVAFGVVGILHFYPYLSPNNFKANAIKSAAILAMVGVSLLLGLLFGMPQFAKWFGNNPRVSDMAQKVAPFQVLLGMVGIAACVVFLYYRFIGIAIPFPD
jgi:hypothetical protein